MGVQHTTNMASAAVLQQYGIDISDSLRRHYSTGSLAREATYSAANYAPQQPSSSYAYQPRSAASIDLSSLAQPSSSCFSTTNYKNQRTVADYYNQVTSHRPQSAIRHSDTQSSYHSNAGSAWTKPAPSGRIATVLSRYSNAQPQHQQQSSSCQQSTGNYKHDKIVFLDVDGVLHSCMARTQAELFKPDCMHLLKQIIDATGAKLVLSSAWRKTGQARDTVSGELRKYGITSFFDCTRDGGNEYARHTDIQ